MTASNFTFLESTYPKLFLLAELAERSIWTDPANTLTKLRILSEKICLYLLEYEGIEHYEDLKQHDRLAKLKRETDFPAEIFDTLHEIRKSGNKASHDVHGTSAEAKFMLRKMFQLCIWFYELYEDDVQQTYTVPVLEEASSPDAIKELEAKLEASEIQKVAFEKKIAELLAQSESQKEERNQRKQRSLRKTEETEAETRERIDQQLRDAEWICDTNTYNYKKNHTLPAKGKNMAIAEWKCGSKWADYALFVGQELVGIVEAKKHISNVKGALGQARDYAEIVKSMNEIQFPFHANHQKYSVPFLFSTNGRPYLKQYEIASGIWFWDARKQTNLEKPLTAWFSPKDLKEKLAFDEEVGADKLALSPYDILTDSSGLNLRPYQVEAIKGLEEKILKHPEDPRALIAMATGTGKTRTMIGMCYRLIKSGRFKRILFMVDRTMLGKQAADAFKEVKVEGLQTFGEIYDLQDLKAAATELDTKIHFATVQSMVKRIEYGDNPPSVGEYDCIVVDEAHRGYTLDKDMDDEEFILRDQDEFQSKYRAVLDYFDAYRIGLTATPAIHTEEIFGKPVFNYSYRRAVVEGYLIDFEPPVVFKTKLSDDGIIWEKGDTIKIYDPEDNDIKEQEVTEDEVKVEIQGFNRRVITESFNQTVLSELVNNPEYAIHPDDKQKTLIFAATDAHADQIVAILYKEYEAMGEDVDVDAIKKITGSVKEREDLLNRFKNDQYPSIVVTVDLLTTGIDVPSICKLIFLRRVNSRILYDQMIGRATRKCDDIGKDVFHIYDCVGVTEIMSKEDVMKPIAPLVTKTFVDLKEELALIEEDVKIQIKLDRIIAKLQRKVRSLSTQQLEEFQHLAKENDPSDLGLLLKSLKRDQLKAKMAEYQPLWEYLDRQKPKKGYAMLYSDHVDELKDTYRAYDKNLKPKDYIESFVEYIETHQNEVTALKLVVTRPQELTRADLIVLRLQLDADGFSDKKLNTAYKELTNQEAAADIISLIRTASLGSPLISHTDRIKNAVSKLKASQQWNPVQLKWLDKIEAALLKDSILSVSDLDKLPFSNDGGLKKLDKVFKGETATIIKELNDYLYA